MTKIATCHLSAADEAWYYTVGEFAKHVGPLFFSGRCGSLKATCMSVCHATYDTYIVLLAQTHPAMMISI